MATLRIGVFGGRGVGKTCSVTSFVHKNVYPIYDPTLEVSDRKMCEIDGEVYVLEIYDKTYGDQCYPHLFKQLIKKNQAFLLVYSITSRVSFDEIIAQRKEIFEAKESPLFSIVLIGNKCDLEMNRQVSREEGQELASIFQCPFFETSAKDRVNIEAAYFELVRVSKLYNLPSANKPRK